MKIAIIGTGNVGGALGKAWARAGHTIIYGSRNATSDKVTTLLDETGAGATAISEREAAAQGDVIVLALPWNATQEVIEQLGDLSGRILIDTNNPLAPDLAGLTIGTDNSAAEEVARWAAGARVVKAFNHIGAGRMGNPQFGDQTADLFICGDDADAKQVVTGLIKDIGFGVIDCGPLTSARQLEPLALLWINLALKFGFGPDIAFKLLQT